MRSPKVVLIVCAIDQDDILEDFIDWHLHLGVDLVLVQDFDSQDGSRALLDRWAKTGRVSWFSLPERDMAKYNPGDALAEMARDKFQADWIILGDADEFLCPLDADLKTILRDAERNGYSALDVPRFNMTGPEVEPGQRAVSILTLRIDKGFKATQDQKLSGDLTVPQIFLDSLSHVIVRAKAFQAFGPGAHTVAVSDGKCGNLGRLRFLHYNMRTYDKFETKVRNAARWLDDNKHLDRGWGWHWRRWIRLHGEGRLRDEYAAQFVSPQRAEELIGDGTCSIDETVANWFRKRNRGWLRRVLAGFTRRISE